MKKMMMFFVMCLFTNLIYNSSYANEKITYYHIGTKSAPALKHTEPMIENFKKNGINVDFKLGLGCGGKNQFNDEKNPALFEFSSGRYWQTLQMNDNLCNIDLSNVKYLSVTQMWYQIVVPVDSKIKTFDDIAKVKSIAFPDGSAAFMIINEINKKFNTQIKAIKFVNSEEVAKGVLAGDADIAIMADITAEKMEKNKLMKIIVYGNPKIDNNIFKHLPNLPKNIGIVSASFIRGVKNGDDLLYQKLFVLTQDSKKQLDIQFPNNEFFTIKSIDDKEIISFVEESIFQLHQLTKNIQ